jgi:hypothetical protein
MGPAWILEALAEVQAGLDDAADRLLDHLGRALALADDAALKQELVAAMEACAFHDLAGQRLARLAAGLTLQTHADPLLNGPADRGEGLDQSDIDLLLSA